MLRRPQLSTRRSHTEYAWATSLRKKERDKDFDELEAYERVRKFVQNSPVSPVSFGLVTAPGVLVGRQRRLISSLC